MPTHIRKGDEVMIRSGDFKGATGTVVRMLTKTDRVVVKGARIKGITKTLKPTRINPQGGQVMVDRSFHVSAVSPVVDGKAARVRFETKKDGSKVRVAVAGGKVLKELGVVRSANAKKKTSKKSAAKA
ncbi:MAG: 50S ribosomal protein L24 [Phycisphaerae bacterium]|nr:50S ribosomal protein L24 [Phycisphaerae bacterium]